MAAVKITMSMPEQLLQRVNAYANDNGMTRSAFITMCVKQYLQSVEAMPTVMDVMRGFAKLVGDAKLMSEEDVQVTLEEIEENGKKVMGKEATT